MIKPSSWPFSKMRRYLSSTLRYLNSSSHFKLVYAKLLGYECFKPLIGKLPTGYSDLEPYKFSKLINDAVSLHSLSDEQAVPIHNKMVEELSRYEYGVGIINAKKVEQIDGQLSQEALHEIIRNNPGRVHDAWELLQKIPKVFWADSLLLVALENTISRNAYRRNGKRVLPLKSLAHSLVLLQNIDLKQYLKEEILDILIISILENKSSIALQQLLQYHLVSLKPFVERIDELTPYQCHEIYRFFSLELLRTEEELFFKIINLLGKLQKTAFSEEEIRASEQLRKYLHEFGGSPEYGNLFDPNDFCQDYLSLKHYVIGNKLDLNDFKLARNLLRIEGIYRDNLDHALDLYFSYLSIYRDQSNELMSEMFLCYAYQSYKTSNLRMFMDAKAFLPATHSENDTLNIVSIEILVNSKFDKEKSLELYNTNIDAFVKKGTLASSLLTKSLIMAYLFNQDLCFARLIFEGAIRENVLSSHIIIQDLKCLFKICGYATEKGNVKEVMQREILKIFENSHVS